MTGFRMTGDSCSYEQINYPLATYVDGAMAELSTRELAGAAFATRFRL